MKSRLILKAVLKAVRLLSPGQTSSPMSFCSGKEIHFFSRKWGDCVLVRHYNIIAFSLLLPERAFKGCSIEFLPTKGNEVLISAYKNKISSF